jgi:hypothetical protein
MITQYSAKSSAVAFYGIQATPEGAQQFYDIVVNWCSRHECPPDKLAVVGPGYSGKPVHFSRPDSKLRREGFVGVSMLSIIALAPGARIPMMDYLISGDYSEPSRFGSIVSRSSIVSLADPDMLYTAKAIMLALKPEYAIGYNRPHQWGPAMYAMGIQQGLGLNGTGVQLTDEEAIESQNIWAWRFGLQEKVWNSGRIREVYPWNFLNETQLAAPVGDITLRNWIRSDPKRGSLAYFESDLCMWEVQPEQVPAIRTTLDYAGVIFRRKYPG